MTRSAATVIENNFIKGLVTEATGLNYPENSCVLTWDCEFDFFGRVARRLAFDLEFGFAYKTIDSTGKAISSYHWKNVTGDGLISLVVVQIGMTLLFYDTSNLTSLSSGVLAATVDLSPYVAGGYSTPGLYECQFTDGVSKLYVFHPYLESLYITYSAGTFTAHQYTVQVRDFEGATADPYAVDFRPTTSVAGMEANHHYNLYNQGWLRSDGSAPELTAWDTARTDVPSNADVWWHFKNASDAFDTTTIINSGNGNTAAPRGHLIFNAWNMTRSAYISGVSDTTAGTSRPSTGAFHAGRVFHSGVRSGGYVSKIYFSQIIQRDADAGKCYQDSDPTSEDLFDLLPADGGVISIPEAGTIYKLFSIANGLLVFAYRGVWFITGSTGIGFTATDFTVSKLSSIRTVSATSFIDVNGVPMWWNTDGIWTVNGGQGSPQVQSMSLNTIQTFYDDIPNNSKLYARGIFNPLEQVVHWLYSSTEPGSIDDQHSFDRVLNYNVLTSAFYPWSISDSTQKIHGAVVVDGTGGLVQQNTVVNNAAATVVDHLGNTVVSYSLTNTGISQKTKFLTSVGTGFTWSEVNNPSYIDWQSLSPVDYTSRFITGYKVHGNALMKFAPMYLKVYNEGVGQAYIQGIWDYSLTSDTGRYSTRQYMNFNDSDYFLQSKRVKIRGQGYALQYYVQSVSGQPFNMTGWSALETGNTQP